MEFGYPGANTSLENHDVSEESFWPSFTDIMMVIVMVFLLVTVAVILNNWSLISDLKNSIQAQEIAAQLVENKQAENTILGSKLSVLEKKIIILNKKYEKEKFRLLNSQKLLTKTQEALSQSQQQLIEKKSVVISLKEELQVLSESLAAEKSTLASTEERLIKNQQKLEAKEIVLTKLQADLINTNQEKDELVELNKSYHNMIAEIKKSQQSLQEKLNTSKATISSLEQQQIAKDKQVELDALETAQEQQKGLLIDVTNTGQKIESDLKTALTGLKESKRIISAMNNTIIESEKKISLLKSSINELNNVVAAKNIQIKEKDGELLALKNNTQLRSLQDKYDTLDAKYKKLLRPARSSEGKFIVSITYKKKNEKRIIRLKSSPTGSYKTVTKKELDKTLAKLKAKYQTDLYIKVIIPETSGLSYSEAWKFTSNVQKKYDYYYQTDKK